MKNLNRFGTVAMVSLILLLSACSTSSTHTDREVIVQWRIVESVDYDPFFDENCHTFFTDGTAISTTPPCKFSVGDRVPFKVTE